VNDGARRTRRACDAARVETLALHLERAVDAPREVVFRMHSEPELFARWFGPRGFTVSNVEADVRVGGTYRIEMQPPEGDAFFIVGEFVAVEPPVRLSYTFRYEDPDPDDLENVVVFSLDDRGDSTGVSVDQSPFATEARRELHREGWTDTLDRLAVTVTEA
jgi:uncharacterized protein YndB with AHSA1/START domain